MTTPRPRAVSRFVLVAVAVPVVVIAGAVLLQLGARDALPDPIAIHWGADGAPDGFGAPWVTVLATVLVGLGVPLLIAASAVNGLRRGDRGPTYRLMGALAAAMSAGAGVLMTSSVLIQRGLADAAAGPSLLPWLVLAGLIAIGVGVAGWLVQPDERLPATGSIATMDPPLTDGERAVWLRSVHLARAGVVVLCAAWALLVVVAVITLTVGAGATVATILALLIAVMAAVIAATAVFHVRVDETGLTVTSATGFPRFHVPVAEIERVEVVEVSPMGEYGDWGLRWAPGRGFGVVLRAGAGIRVHRTGGKVFTVTVDDAETGAALLSAERERTERER
ncbi:MAG: hypothetical protein BGN98_03105 [Microbacterium sp. 69-7]|uniref:DUF1648 domain-containing protein n=1 Tax=Microbacterium sp. 69-7 TaxID=1895784 RepID=UPI000966301D|nr:DUF1648 domain-containing protein [Microbacterium sp. 69-7]OJU42891.1 MAG: hypothetical protein BGN98_03105 [Microbacterium sp. 69-7]